MSPERRLYPWPPTQRGKTSTGTVPGARCHYTSGISTPSGGEKVNSSVCKQRAVLPTHIDRTGPAFWCKAGARHRGGSEAHVMVCKGRRDPQGTEGLFL